MPARERVCVKRERENRVKLGVSAASHASPNRATAKSFRFRPQQYRTDYHDYHHHNHFISPPSPSSVYPIMAANGLYNIYRLAIPVATGAMIVNSSLYDVRGGTRAVIFDRLSGVQERVVNEGTHFLIPWLQRAIVYDVRTKPRNISTTTGSKDLQMVSLTLRVLHRPDVPKLPVIYQVSSLKLKGRVNEGE